MLSCAGADRAGCALSAGPARSRSHEVRRFVLFQSLSLFSHQATAVTESDAAPVALAVRASDRVDTQAAIARGAPPGAIAHARSLAIATLDLDVLKPPAALRRSGAPPFVAGNRVSFEPVPGLRVAAHGQRVEQGLGAWTWVGRIAEPSEGSAIFTEAGGRLAGSIDVGTRRFVLHGAGYGQVIVREVDASGLGRCATRDQVAVAGKATSIKKDPLPPRAAAKVSPGRTIDVMVLYSSAVVANQGGDPAALINQLIAEMNAAYVAGNIDAAVRVVHYGEQVGVVDPASL
jgi:hypothetical protein